MIYASIYCSMHEESSWNQFTFPCDFLFIVFLLEFWCTNLTLHTYSPWSLVADGVTKTNLNITCNIDGLFSTCNLPVDVRVLIDLGLLLLPSLTGLWPNLECACSSMKFSTDKVMQQPFPVLCGSGLYFPFYYFDMLLLAAISSGRQALPQLWWLT